MDIKEKIKEIIEKPVKDREEWEHHFLIRFEFSGSVRNYLLSMGKFKEDNLEEELEGEKKPVEEPITENQLKYLNKLKEEGMVSGDVNPEELTKNHAHQIISTAVEAKEKTTKEGVQDY